MARVALHELLELVENLRNEHLFISAEKRKLNYLNEEVRRLSDRLFERAWTARQQRNNVDRYILNQQDIETARRRASQLDAVQFVDSYRVLGNEDPVVGALVKALRESPKLLALFLDRCEQLFAPPTTQRLVSVVMVSFYGDCLLPEDLDLALVLLYELMHLQLPRKANQLRRLLQNRACTFSCCYKSFVESHLPARLFLTSALREAVVKVIAHDDLYLDIEPNTAVIRFSHEERLRHFGQEGTLEYENQLKAYHAWTVRKLTALAQNFVSGIAESMQFCFPPALAWIVRQFYSIVYEEDKLEPREIALSCIDLVFYFFICPAIVNPELYGVIEEGLHISVTARFNLMQVARIVRVLAMARYEPIDVRLEDICRAFDKALLSNIVEEIIQGASSQERCEFSELVNGAGNVSGETIGSPKGALLLRNAILISPLELHELVITLRRVFEVERDGSLLHEWLHQVLEHVPAQLTLLNLNQQDVGGIQSQDNSNVKRTIINKVSRIRNNSFKNQQNSEQSGEAIDENNVPLRHGNKETIEDITTVLVVVLPTSTRRDLPGCLSEEKILSLDQVDNDITPDRARHQHSARLGQHSDSNLVENDKKGHVEAKSSTVRRVKDVSDHENADDGTVIGKRTRFFPSVDQESIAGTSDNLEAGLSEAASVASSLDTEDNDDPDVEVNDDDDNLSDMVSANVSGPGTPSVSGRDTPSSHGAGTGASTVAAHSSQLSEHLHLLQNSSSVNAIPTLANGVGNNLSIATVSGSNVQSGGGSQVAAGSSCVGGISSGNIPSRRKGTAVRVEPQKPMDIEDRFGRFGIGKSPGGESSSLAGEEETKSMVSDTWSTDVLASDSEATTSAGSVAAAGTNNSVSAASVAPNSHANIERLAFESHLNAIQHQIHSNFSQNNISALQNQQLIEFSETQSDAWSTAAMTSYSDVERLQEVDQEDQDDLGMVPPAAQDERRDSVEDNIESEVSNAGSGPTIHPPTLVMDRTDCKASLRDHDSSLSRLPTGAVSETVPFIEISDGVDNTVFSNEGTDTAVCHANNSRTTRESLELLQDPCMLHAGNTRQQADEGTYLFEHSLPDGSIVGFGSASFNASLEEPQGTQSLGKLTFAMKEHSPSRENLHDDLLLVCNGMDIAEIVPLCSAANGASAEKLTPPDVQENGLKIHNCTEVFDPANLEESADLPRPGIGSSKRRSSKDTSGLPFLDAYPVVENLPSTKEDVEQRELLTRGGAIPKTFTKPPSLSPSQPQVVFLERSTASNARQGRPGTQRGFLRKIGTIKQSISSKVKTLDKNSGFRKGFSAGEDHNGLNFSKIVPMSPSNISCSHAQTGSSGPISSTLSDHFHEQQQSTSTAQFLDPAEILEKYRGKNRRGVSDLAAEDSSASVIGLADNASSVSGGDLLDLDDNSEVSDKSSHEIAFRDAKRKLRTVLSTANTETLQLHRYNIDLLLLLKMLLAESVGLQNHQLTSQLHEAIRCISKLDLDMQQRVFCAMREDYRQRYAYLSYLIRSRQKLERTVSTLQSLLSHVKKDRNISQVYLTTLCVQDYLQALHRKQSSLSLDKLVLEFKQINLSDEKAHFVYECLDKLNKEMAICPVWQGNNEEILSLSESILERLIMGKLYVHALFPNGDIDLHRDQVLTVHIHRLAQVITPFHKALRIPRRFLLECPWPSAQAAIMALNAYKTPRDKLNCVFLCCKIILDLLHLGSNSVVAADDLFPILVYVLIQANPQYLLSNIEYVKQFCPAYQNGEAGYYWTMLDSAVVFIKSLEYN